MIDKALVNRKIVLISKDFEELTLLAKLSLPQYHADFKNEVLAERYLERMIGRMIDINYHLLTETGKPPPTDYFNSFLELAEIDAYPLDFAKKVAPAAGLRNRLVHEYDEIDPEKVYRGLKAAVSEVPQYLNYVKKFVERR